MLGTYLNLPRYEELAKRYGAFLYVDDAHGFGVVGHDGRGIVSHYDRSYENTIYVGSFEKGLASLGGFVVVPRESRDYFRFNSYTYTFSGQLPPPYLASALTAFDILEREGQARLSRLRELIARVKREVQDVGFEIVGEDHPFPLVMVKVGDLQTGPGISRFFYEEGIHILTVGFPVVPLSKGAMVRIALSATHTDAQIDRLIEAFGKLRLMTRDNSAFETVQHDFAGDTSRKIAA
jgi:7-keto-8-aminopelargonate synthetase-like enzyme